MHPRYFQQTEKMKLWDCKEFGIDTKVKRWKPTMSNENQRLHMHHFWNNGRTSKFRIRLHTEEKIIVGMYELYVFSPVSILTLFQASINHGGQNSIGKIWRNDMLTTTVVRLVMMATKIHWICMCIVYPLKSPHCTSYSLISLKRVSS